MSSLYALFSVLKDDDSYPLGSIEFLKRQKKKRFNHVSLAFADTNTSTLLIDYNRSGVITGYKYIQDNPFFLPVFREEDHFYHLKEVPEHLYPQGQKGILERVNPYLHYPGYREEDILSVLNKEENRALRTRDRFTPATFVAYLLGYSDFYLHDEDSIYQSLKTHLATFPKD